MPIKRETESPEPDLPRKHRKLVPGVPSTPKEEGGFPSHSEGNTMTKMAATSDPAVHRELGGSVNNFDKKEWAIVKGNIMMQATNLKFTQSDDATNLKRKLLSLKNCDIYEISTNEHQEDDHRVAKAEEVDTDMMQMDKEEPTKVRRMQSLKPKKPKKPRKKIFYTGRDHLGQALEQIRDDIIDEIMERAQRGIEDEDTKMLQGM
ncbi:hypothetical protein DM02DRAFT_672533 [Periconia macrospinosa]|uniref:NADAR domain-containing protein n=1 Tax=Periconia macrospinosa TaxID=97972 RepID=A0A2V1DP55_9PLEO|nr:hypothetical protein DM02DRAFT_672533 [Periconia macrospinosa]